jgi:glycine cleavage system aminomethyltransferase T
VLDHEVPLPEAPGWSVLRKGDAAAGHVTAMVWSPRLGRNIGLCLVSTAVVAGDEVRVTLEDGTDLTGRIRDLPFL